jgi:hypothetical protein
MLDLLEAHFRVQPYLLGERPTIGDFGLQGPLYGHLGRDPWPKREWIAPRPAVRDWIDRMASLGHEAVSARFAATELSSASPTATLSAPLSAQQDHLAPTLEALLVQVIRDFLPMAQAVVEEVNRAYATQPAGKLLPRAMAEVEFPMAGQRYRSRPGSCRVSSTGFAACLPPNRRNCGSGCADSAASDCWTSSCRGCAAWRCVSALRRRGRRIW